jgi:hypothetical protein
MNKLLVALGALSVLSGCAMTPDQTAALMATLGGANAGIAAGQAYIPPPPRAQGMTCWDYGGFTRCNPD